MFLLSDYDDQSLANDLRVEVKDTRESKVLHQTRTSKDGTFVLPSLDVGTYELRAGKLIVELKVEDAEPTPGRTRLPKTILIIMPEGMKE